MTNLANGTQFPAGISPAGPGRVGLTLVDPDGTMAPSASQEYRVVLAGMEQLLTEIACRLEHQPGLGLPGIADVGETVVLYTATTRRAAYGWYCGDIWHHARNGPRFSEIGLNADHLDRPANEVLRTLVHELVHAYAAAIGIKDTRRGGAYHNNRFGELAIRAGLAVERRPSAGCFTVGLSPLGESVYGDLLDDLENLITLPRTPQCPGRYSDNGGIMATRDPMLRQPTPQRWASRSWPSASASAPGAVHPLSESPATDGNPTSSGATAATAPLPTPPTCPDDRH